MQTSRIPAFWWGWLAVAFVFTGLASIAYILFPDGVAAMFGTALLGSADAFRADSDVVQRFIGYLSGFSGAVSLAWMVTLLFIVLGPFRRAERWAWQAVTASVVIWFVVDSARSIEMGFSQNALFNLVWLAIYCIPLIATYRHFHHGGTTTLRERDATV